MWYTAPYKLTKKSISEFLLHIYVLCLWFWYMYHLRTLFYPQYNNINQWEDTIVCIIFYGRGYPYRRKWCILYILWMYNVLVHSQPIDFYLRPTFQKPSDYASTIWFIFLFRLVNVFYHNLFICERRKNCLSTFTCNVFKRWKPIINWCLPCANSLNFS